jgi:RNA polymerase sigma-70 factor (ECF subfamily)
LSGQRPDHTLQTTALVNEAYLRLADQTDPRLQNRAHFFAVAARAMRQILVSYARSQRAEKRGGGALKVELDEAAIVSPEQSKEIVDLHEALEQLSVLDSRKAQVVELKFFGGLNYD